MTSAIFDYEAASRELQIPPQVLQNLKTQVQGEFPNDDMLMELHVLRALKAYARKRRPGGEDEN